MISNLRPTVKLRRLRNGLIGPLVLIASMSLLVAPTAHAGFFDQLKQASQAFKQIKHEVGNLPASTPAPTNQQPATAPHTTVTQPPSSKPSATLSGTVSPASASSSSSPMTIAQKIVGPILSGNDTIGNGISPYSVSPHGSHFASVHMQGSRYVVTVDGKDGPRVSAVIPIFNSLQSDRATAEAVAMSNDGKHYAYVARVRGKIVVFEDGRKILQFSQQGAIQMNYYLVFSPLGGAHLFFAATKYNTEDEELWVDGKPAPLYISHIGEYGSPFNVMFSADGQHYLYVGTPGNRSSKRVLIMDGKQVSYSVEGIDQSPAVAPRFTADGRYVLCVTNGYVGKTNRKHVGKVLLDGKPVVTAEFIDSLVTAPMGSRFATVVDNHGRSQYAVYLNGTEVPATRFTPQNDHAMPVAKFSPDGKHLAVACNYGAGNAYVVLDGKQGETYDKIYAEQTATEHVMNFSADSHSFGYFAAVGTGAGTKTFAVVNGHEYDPGFDGPGELYFSPKGHHVAVVGEAADASGHVVYVDSRRIIKDRLYFPGTFVFSRDGLHWLIEDGSGSDMSIRVDGRTLPFSFYGKPNHRFSPDGSELAIAASYRNKGSGLFLYNTSTKRILRLTPGLILGGGASDMTNVYTFKFSPDSKHLYYAGPVNSRLAQAMIYVDGKKTGAQLKTGYGVFPSLVLQSQKAATWQVGADDKLHALCDVNNKVVRFTITPPPGGLS